MGIELFLEKATDNQLKDALNATELARQFHKQGYELFLGKEIDGQRNQFWQHPESNESGYSYSNNLVHIPGTLIGTFSYVYKDSISEESKGRIESIITDALQRLIFHIEENLQMCSDVAINKKGKSLNVPNEEIFNDFSRLMGEVKKLIEPPFEIKELRARVDALYRFYSEQIFRKYMAYEDKLK